MLSTLIARIFGHHDAIGPCRRRKGTRRKSRRFGRGFQFEPVEGRLLLSVDLVGIPLWDSQGPAPTINGQVSASPDNAVSGAIEALAAHPTNPDILFAGGSVGGIWKTTNATSTTPNWQPLTDQYPTLAISDLAFSPLDATGNTLFAGTGGFNNGGINGAAQGMLRTTDGGQTWQLIGQTEFGNSRIRSVVPTSIGTSLANQVVLVAAIDGSGGVYRSVNGGTSFALVSGTAGNADGLDNDADGTTDEAGELNLPTGAASYLAPDPGNPNRFYAAIPGSGIYRSDNGGANWVQVNNGLTGVTAQNIELSVSPAAGNPVYASFVSGGTLANVFRSADQGANWAAIGAAPNVTPGGQGFNDFSMLADRTNANLVYVAGDRQPASPWFGNIFRGDASAGSWTDMTTTADTLLTAPHADSRDMVFDASGNLIEADDGGVFRLINPAGSPSLWTNLNRNLSVAQFYSTPYDHVLDVIFGGTQDTGSPRQTAPGSHTWSEVNLGDGGTAGVGYFPWLGSEVSVQYTMGNNFGTFERHFSDGALELVLGGQLGLTGLAADDSGFSGFTTFAYEVNPFSAARLAIGGLTQLYESSDFGNNLTVITPAGVTGVSAIAYGGSLGGVANPDLLYVGIGGDLYLRTTAGGAFSNLTAYPGGAPQDIALDPDDWRSVYVTDGNAVYHSADSTAAGATWVNLNSAQQLGMAGGGLRTIEVFGGSPAIGDEILLAGGNNGVFRTRNPGAGTNAMWTEFGANLPNAPVADVQYDATDDVLVASAYGRGVWKIPNASTYLPLPGVLQINGDTLYAGQDDFITLTRNPNLTTLLNVHVGGVPADFTSVPITAVEQINVNGLGGKDTLIVDSSSGLISVVNGIRYDGGEGSDALRLEQTGGTTHTSDTYSVGPDIGAGNSRIEDGSGATAIRQNVDFFNLEPVVDLVPATTLTVNATGDANDIQYRQLGGPGQATISVDNFESITFANKTNLVIGARGGADTIYVGNNATPTGLTSITINAGPQGDGNTLAIDGASRAVTIDTAARTITGATGETDHPVGITYNGLDSIALTSGVTGLTLNTTGADDSLVVTPGATGTPNHGTLQSAGAFPSISFVNSGAVNAGLGLGADQVQITGTSGADTVTVGGSAVAITGRNTVNYSGIEAVAVQGGTGGDTFTVTPSAVAVFVDGGDPIGTDPGDKLVVAAGTGAVTYNAGPQGDEGSFGVDSNASVSFDRLESLAVSGTGPVTVNGTNGPDAISVVARDSSTHGEDVNGVRDFTVSVNSGPAVLFVNVASLTVIAGAGSDEMTLVAPAPNNAAWDVDVEFDGRPPAVLAEADRLFVQTPGGSAETVKFYPNAVDGGSLNMSSLSSLITLTRIDAFVYDGRNDGDTLEVNGTTADDMIVHTPAGNDQAGTITVNNLLPVTYQNLGTAATLQVLGGPGADNLTVTGTAANDRFTVEASRTVALNQRLKLYQPAVESLTIQGLSGDDWFTLEPEIAASPYSGGIDFFGGDQASASGDRMYLAGGLGNDEVAISGQEVWVGGRRVTGSGVENIRLDALAGIDSVTYNGVDSITENITVSSSGVQGGGQISVPGVTLVDFKNVERIDVNGNAPTSTETDTLAFAGTNAADIFRINLAAAGTGSDPILKLYGTPSGAPLFALGNYTNFATLRILGLDGADTFNVYTSDAGPADRNVFIDGGLPTAKKKSTDVLNVYYAPSRPRIIHSTATQNPGSGLVDLLYANNRRYLVQYADIENVVIAKGTAP
jgi:hypothetical protein